MSVRSSKKPPYVAYYLQERLEALNAANKQGTFITFSRASTITPAFLGHWFKVHNGKKFIPFLVTENMVGHKLGEFAPTRTFKGHKTKGKK